MKVPKRPSWYKNNYLSEADDGAPAPVFAQTPGVVSEKVIESRRPGLKMCWSEGKFLSEVDDGSPTAVSYFRMVGGGATAFESAGKYISEVNDESAALTPGSIARPDLPAKLVSWYEGETEEVDEVGKGNADVKNWQKEEERRPFWYREIPKTKPAPKDVE